jgi:hypothetical protein
VVSLVLNAIMHWYFLRRTTLTVPLRRATLGNVVALGLGWLSASALAQTTVPQWGTSWTSLPLGAGWGPFLAVTLLTGLMYTSASFALRVLSLDDLRLLLQLARR